MKYLRYPQYKPLDKVSKGTVVSIGNFDGVHLGHQTLIKLVASTARTNNLKSVIVTMQPLASEYFNRNTKTTILTPFKNKFKLIQQLNVDFLCVLNFNKNLAELSAEDFISRILINGLNAKHIIVGDDFRFGKNRSGDFKLLKKTCEPLAIAVESIDTVTKMNNRVSSSQIRNELNHSNFQIIEKMLGRKYSILGKVSKGKQLGRKLEFPTINIKLKNRHVPLNGIYCVKVLINGGIQKYIGAASIGTRPTVGGVEKLLEVFILNFNMQVYGQNVEVLFYQKIRNEVKFNSLIELKRHIKEDVIKTRLFFSNYI